MSATPDARPVSVLLVDDHVVFAQSLARVLNEQPSLTVVALAGTGETAIEAVRRYTPDVVLMDQALPDGLGTDVARRILGRWPETRVLMLTASEDEDVLVAAIQAGCAGYLTKFTALDEVVDAVITAHAGDAVMTPAMLKRLLPRFGRREGEEPPPLSKREMEVLELMAEGLPNAVIAERLYISAHTVRNHIQNILTRLGAHSKLEAVSIAVKARLIRIG